jgi:hypothetical protein
VQSKAIAHPTDSRLLEVARDKIARLAKRAGIQLKQTHEREGKACRPRPTTAATGTPSPRCWATPSCNPRPRNCAKPWPPFTT